MFHLLLQGLFPVECVICKKPNQWLCSAHQKITCAPPNQVHYQYLDEIHVATAYQDPVIKKCIERFKFGGARHLAIPLAHILFTKLPPTVFKHTTIVPIPLHWRRQLWRGYNQTKLLTKALQTLEPSLILNDTILSRSKATKQQARLSKSKRLKNIAQAFTVRGTAPKNIILLDDVVASGSTLDEAARILKNAGALKVTAIVLSRGG